MKIAEPGIYAISAEEYHADPTPAPSLSASLAKILCNDSPWHAWTAHPRLNPQAEEEDKHIFDIGTIAHALLLEGENVAEILNFDSWRKNEAKDARDAARRAGKIPILEHHWKDVEAMVLAARRQIDEHKEIHDAFVPSKGKPEQTIVWREPNGIWCRARLDWLANTRARVYDYKSTGTSANPETISRLMVSSGWDIQAAFYLRGLQAVDPVAAAAFERSFYFVVQETYPPHALCAIGIHPTFKWSGEKAVDLAIERFAACMAEDHWPGYPDRVCYPELPAWKENQITAAELREVEL